MRAARATIHAEWPMGEEATSRTRVLSWALALFVLGAGLRLWFVTIHPFDDGNGLIMKLFPEIDIAQYDACRS